MNKIFATVTKEITLLLRDRAGLLLLFLMPLLLIIIMALLQDAPFKDYQELRFEVLMVDDDKGDLAKKMRHDLSKSKQYKIIESYDNVLLTKQKTIDLIQAGTYKAAILIPEKASDCIKKKSAQSAQKLLSQMGMKMEPDTTQNTAPDSSHIVLYFDPATKRTFKNAMSYNLQRIINQSEMQMMLDYMMSESEDSAKPTFDLNQLEAVKIVEQSSNPELKEGIVGNSVQHNVPAWSIFALFFIVIPVSGQIITERQEGTLQRLKLISGSYLLIQIGKVCSYMVVNLLQFCTMLLVGIFLMPFIGLPSLQIGQQPLALLCMIIGIAFSASSFALFVGTIFKTPTQALPFGASTVVILSALGGIWIPVEAMPPLLQQIATISPLHWALEGINNILLRGNGLESIALSMTVLMCFGCFMLVLSYFYEKNND